MPIKPKSPCTWPGCGALCDGGRCDKHRAQNQREVDARRGSAHERGYDNRWQKARAAYLRAHPLCKAHESINQVVAASVVDHIIPHKGNKQLFWNSGNWQSLCKRCHDEKTAREDGGFGRNLSA